METFNRLPTNPIGLIIIRTQVGVVIHLKQRFFLVNEGYRRESFLCMGGDRLLAPCIQRTMGKSLNLPFFHKVLGRIAFITYPCRKRVGLPYGFNKPCCHVGIVDAVPGAKAHKKPRRQRECRQGLIMSKISREKDDQSSLLSSRLPSFLACSTTAGTSMSGRIS